MSIRQLHVEEIQSARCSSTGQVSTNAFVGAYVERLLEQQRFESDEERDASISSNSEEDSEPGGDHQHEREGATRKREGLTFTEFVHVFWVFSASASRGEKEQGERFSFNMQ